MVEVGEAKGDLEEEEMEIKIMFLILMNTYLLVVMIGKMALNIEGEEDMARRKWIRGKFSAIFVINGVTIPMSVVKIMETEKEKRLKR